jgi:DNA repair protein RAD5
MPFERKDPTVMDTVKALLAPLMLRRTRDMRDKHGNALIDLPNKTIDIVRLDFSPSERELYDALYHASKSRFRLLCASGSVLSHYASIFQLLTRWVRVHCVMVRCCSIFCVYINILLFRLRQICNHSFLVLKAIGKASAADLKDDVISVEELLEQLDTTFTERRGATSDVGQRRYVRDVLDKLEKSGNEAKSGETDRALSGKDTSSSMLLDAEKSLENKSDQYINAESIAGDVCPICFEELFDASVLPCFHFVCRACIMEYIERRNEAGKEGE